MRNLFFILLCLLFIYKSTLGQAPSTFTENKYFRTISIDQGLSQNTVFAIQQDQLGFIWVGTQEGLNRYDGKTFTIYRPQKKDNNSLFSSYIRSLFVDSIGMLWIGGNKGISCYNYKRENFTNYPLPVKPGEWFISSITTDKSNTIWLASNTGEIYYQDRKEMKFLPFHYNVSKKNFENIQQLMFIEGDLYLATDKGVYKIDKGFDNAKAIHPETINSRINSMVLQNNNLWLASEVEGLFCLNISNGNIGRYKHEAQGSGSLVDNDVRSMALDQDNNLWVGTFRGLSIFDPSHTSFSNFEHHTEKDYSLSQNSVRCIFKDKQNGMWLGTFWGGLNYYHKDNIRFNILSRNTGTVLLNDKVVNIIKEAPDNNIWIGTNDNGINLWNRKTNQVSYYTHKEAIANSISSNNIKAITFDAEGNALVGTFNAGLNIIDIHTGAIKTYVHDPLNPHSISGNMVHALLRDQQSRIWVGTRSGLNIFDTKMKTFSLYDRDSQGKQLSSNVITSLLQDHQGRIWIGTINGINIFTPDNGKFEVFNGNTLSDELVSCIAEDQRGRIWVGTREGLNLFDERSRKFTYFPGIDNSIQGIIYSIQQDNDSSLWVSTSKGLVKLSNQLSRSQLFNSQTGLGNNQLGFPAFCKTNDGMMLFGGINGIIYFYPSAIAPKQYSLNVTFTGLDVLNTPVTPYDNNRILNEYINDAKTLSFAHEYKQFTLFFNTFNYISPNSIKYRYMLRGFDYTWQTCENIPKATYTNLKPGNYTFMVQAIGPSGEQSPVRSLHITISPPWWRSNWFYLLSILVVVVTGFIVYRTVQERLSVKNALLKERNDKARIENLNQMKMDFYTNVSHEFKTPLTLIIAPLEELLNKPVPEKKLHRLHEQMLTNARQLYQLVDQLMEFRKTEQGVKKLELTQENIIEHLNNIYASFLGLSRKKNIKYYFKSTQNSLLCHFDKYVIEKICYNLLSNAFKYTPSGGTIELSFQLINEQMVLTVKDSGTGISPADHEHVFERFYQVKDKEKNTGSGVGLAFAKSLAELHHGTIAIESSLDMGTSFIVTIPLNQEQYQVNEFKNEHSFELLLDNMSALKEDAMKEDDVDFQASEISEDLPNLLIVDDNIQIIEYLAGYFERQFKIVTASNGNDALAIVASEPIDIIISDVMMSGLDGIQFCKKVKQNIITCHIPVVLLTAKSETIHHVKGLEAGADDYVTKPFSVSLLEAKMLNILRSRRRLKEHYSSTTEIVPENIALNTMDEELLHNAISIIEEGLIDPDFSVLKLSRKIGMSRSSLYLKLKAITGESTTDFIKRIKFKKATELIESKQHSMTEVAYLSGFSSLSYFSTSFKQYYGCLPTEYLSNKPVE